MFILSSSPQSDEGLSGSHSIESWAQLRVLRSIDLLHWLTRSSCAQNQALLTCGNLNIKGHHQAWSSFPIDFHTIRNPMYRIQVTNFALSCCFQSNLPATSRSKQASAGSGDKLCCIFIFCHCLGFHLVFPLYSQGADPEFKSHYHNPLGTERSGRQSKCEHLHPSWVFSEKSGFSILVICSLSAINHFRSTQIDFCKVEK